MVDEERIAALATVFWSTGVDPYAICDENGYVNSWSATFLARDDGHGVLDTLLDYAEAMCLKTATPSQTF